MDTKEIEGGVAAIAEDTEALLIQLDRKASAALILQRRIAYEMTPDDCRAITRSIRLTLGTMIYLARALTATEQAHQAALAQVGFLQNEARENRRQVDEALELVRDIRGMSWWQLRAFHRELNSPK